MKKFCVGVKLILKCTLLVIKILFWKATFKNIMNKRKKTIINNISTQIMTSFSNNSKPHYTLFCICALACKQRCHNFRNRDILSADQIPVIMNCGEIELEWDVICAVSLEIEIWNNDSFCSKKHAQRSINLY